MTRLRAWFFPFTIFIAGLLPRSFIYFHYYVECRIRPLEPDVFIGILNSHFQEYIIFTDFIPPLTFIIQKLLLMAAGLHGAYVYHAHLLYLFAADAVAAVFLYAAMQKLGVDRWLSWIVATAYSIGLIALEMWFAGGMGHYDAYTTFFDCLFIYGLVCWTTSATWINAFLFAGASCLLILQLSMATYSVPLVLALQAVCLPFWRIRRKERVVQWVAVASSVVLILGVLSFRGKQRTGTYMIGSKGGPAAMMFLQRAVGGKESYHNTPDSVLAIRKFLEEAGAPDWYRWCFDHAIPYVGTDGKPVDGWVYLSRSFGICMPWSPKAGVVGKPWPFDFDDLISNLYRLHQPSLAKIVEKDRSDSYERQYLFQGYSPELSPRWIGVYGAESLRLLKALFFRHPWLYLKTVHAIHRKEYAPFGPLFFLYINAHEYPFQPKVDYFNSRVECPIIAWAYSLFLWGGLMIGISWGLRRSFPEIIPDAPSNTGIVINAYGILLALTVFYSLAFCGLVSVENARYFLYSVPALLVMLAVTLQTGVFLLKRLFFRLLQ